jgi:hypothetical protein
MIRPKSPREAGEEDGGPVELGRFKIDLDYVVRCLVFLDAFGGDCRGHRVRAKWGASLAVLVVVGNFDAINAFLDSAKIFEPNAFLGAANNLEAKNAIGITN